MATSKTCDRIKDILGRAGLFLLVFLAASICVGGVAYIITHVSVRPSIKMLSMSVTPVDLSAGDSIITANWTVEFEVRNPCKKHPINYRDFEVSVSYYDEILSTTKLAPFRQTPKNQTKFTAELMAVLHSLADERIGYAIRRDLYVDGVVSFDVTLRLQFEYERGSGGNPSGQSEKRSVEKPLGYVNFVCGDVGVVYPEAHEGHQWSSGSGTMRGGSKRCRYHKHN